MVAAVILPSYVRKPLTIPRLEITIGRRMRDGARIVAAFERTPGEPPLCFEAPYDLNVDALHAAVDARAYGEALGARVFVGGIRDAWLLACGASSVQRVQLIIEEPDLQALRWERLCAPRDGNFVPMGLDQRCLFSIFQPSRSTVRFRPLGSGDLSALVVVASPSDLSEYSLTPFDTGAATQSVTRSLDETGIAYTVLGTDPSASALPTLDELCSVITAQSPPLLHLICHGQVRARDGESVLYLCDESGKTDAVTATRLLERLALVAHERGLPQCVFLCTCDSASPEAAGMFGNLARRFAQQLAVPAVVAMTDRVSVETGLALGRRFYQALRAHGEVDRAVAEASAVLAERHDALVPVVYSRLGSRPLFSQAPDRPLTAAERAYGLARMRSLVLARAPTDESIWNALEQSVMVWAQAEQEWLPAADRAKLLDAMANVDRFTVEVAGTSFAALCRGLQPEPYDNRCPFRGLQAFSEEDSAFFFGREPLVEQIVDRLSTHRIAAVVGPSGSGKSSVVLAGVVPLLRNRHPGIAVRKMTPGAVSHKTLTSAFDNGGAPSVLVVDQFEELFSQNDDADHRWQVVEALRKASEHVCLILTLRADYVGDCTGFPWLKEVLQHHWVLAAPMGALELRGAIERQAAAVGLRFEPGVCAKIIDQISEQPGAMPLVQHALLELYRRRRGRLLRLEAFEETGGVFFAITQTAERIFQAATAKEQEWLRAIFLRLVRLDADGGAGAVDRQKGTRVRVGIDELRPADMDESALRGQLLRLTDARLLVTSRDAGDDGEGHLDADRVEVAHEALLRHWPRLEEWIRADREALMARQEVERLAVEWQEYEEDPGLLIQPGRKLEDLLPLSRHPRISLTPVAQRFLRASVELKQKQEDHRKARIRTKRALIGSSIVVLAAAAVIMASLWSGAEENRRRESEARALAQSNAVRAEMAQRSAEAAKSAATVAEAAATSQARAAAFAASLASVATVADKDPLTASLLLGETIRIDPDRDGGSGWASAFGLLQRPVPKVAIRTSSPPAAMVFSDDSNRLLTLHDSGKLSLVDTQSGRGGLQFGSIGSDSKLVVSPEGPWVAVAQCDDVVRLWNKNNGMAGAVLRTGNRVCQVRFSEDGALVVTYGGSAEIAVWEVHTGVRIARFQDMSPTTDVRISAKQRVLVTVGSQVRLWDLRTSQLRYSEPLQRDLIPDIELADGGRFLLVVWPKRSLRIVWTETGVVHGGFENQGAVSVQDADVSRDGKSVLMVSESEASLWRVDDVFGLIPVAAPVRRIRNNTEVDAVKAARFSPDGRWIVVQLVGGVGVIARTDTGAVVWRLDSVRGHARLSADGRLLIAQTEWVRVWDLTTGVRIAEFRAGTHRGTAAALSPDNTTIATVVGDGGIGMWNVAPKVDALVVSPRKQPAVVGFSEDGGRVFAGSSTVELWRVDGGVPMGEVALTCLADQPSTVTTDLRTSFGHAPEVVLDGPPDYAHATSAHAPENRGRLGDLASMSGKNGGSTGESSTQVVADPRASWLMLFGDEAVLYQRDGTPQGRVLGWDRQWGVPTVGPGGKWFVAVAQTMIRVWSQEGAVVRDVEMPQQDGATLRQAWILANGTALLVAKQQPRGDQQWVVLSERGGANGIDLTPENQVRSATVDPSGTWVLFALERGGAEAVAATGEGAVELVSESPIVAAAFSNNADLLLTGSEDGVLRIWEVDGWQVRLLIRQSGDTIEKVGFSPDGKWCWSLTKSDNTADGDGMSTGKQLSIFRTTDGMAMAAFDLAARDDAAPGFSPDGKHMALVKSGQLVVVPTTWKELVQKVRTRTQACLSPNQRVLWLGEEISVATERADECERTR